MSYDREPIEAKVAELKPRMKNITITFKVIEKSEPREVTSRRDQETHRVLDAVVGDSTGTVTVPLWDDSIENIEEGATYIHCAQGHGRTGLFTLALLVERGHVRSFEDGYAFLKRVRPGIEMNASQVFFIRQFIADQEVDQPTFQADDHRQPEGPR